MSQESGEPVGHILGCRVLQLAGRLVGLGVLKFQLVDQEDLPQPVTAEDVVRALFSGRCERCTFYCILMFLACQELFVTGGPLQHICAEAQ